MNRRRWAAFAVVAAFGAPGVVASVMTSCATNPNLSPLRSFESAKDIDVVCLQVSTLGTDGGVGGVPLRDLPLRPVAPQGGARVRVELDRQLVLEPRELKPERLPARPRADLDHPVVRQLGLPMAV